MGRLKLMYVLEPESHRSASYRREFKRSGRQGVAKKYPSLPSRGKCEDPIRTFYVKKREPGRIKIWSIWRWLVKPDAKEHVSRRRPAPIMHRWRRWPTQQHANAWPRRQKRWVKLEETNCKDTTAKVITPKGRNHFKTGAWHATIPSLEAGANRRGRRRQHATTSMSKLRSIARGGSKQTLATKRAKGHALLHRQRREWTGGRHWSDLQ